MVFSEFLFLFGFLPGVVAAYYVVPRRWRNGLLAVASLTFYWIGGGAFIFILLASIGVDYVAGWITDSGRAQARPVLVRTGVSLSVLVNLGLLAYFKYANFFVEQINGLGFGQIAWSNVALPIGISFFTFQSMSYTIDVARGRVSHLRSPIDFALYVALFPQLIAGPIVRFHEIASQIESRESTMASFALGASRFSHGLAKKVLIADSVAPLADIAFAADTTELSARAAWIGVFAYTVQIYFDFSGYSDMAIGLGTMFGFKFPENFARPYSALSLTDFWRRWHITLSNWFRDYLYIPLGGSRGSSGKTYRNLVSVFLLTGLWHGASWTFVLWGAYHGTFLAIERASGYKLHAETHIQFDAFRRVATFMVVVIGWVLFRAQSVTHAVEMYRAMTGSTGSVPAELELAMSPLALAALAIGIASMALPRSFTMGVLLERPIGRAAPVARAAVLLVGLPFAASIVASGTFSPFLYYQF